MTDTIIEFKNVSKRFIAGGETFHALKNINLKIRKGDFVTIIGPSGSGKSTLMNQIGCLDTPSDGDVIINGEHLKSMSQDSIAELRGTNIGFIFQQYNLVQNMTVLENVSLPLEIREADEKFAQSQAIKTLEKVGLKGKLNNYPNQLSGGQQQRVSIARCLANDPKIILADEPTGALDSKTGKAILDMLKDLWKKEQKTIIMVTHDLKLADEANTVIKIKDGEIDSIKTKKVIKLKK